MLCALARQGRCSLGLLVRLDRIPAVALELADIDAVLRSTHQDAGSGSSICGSRRIVGFRFISFRNIPERPAAFPTDTGCALMLSR